MGYTEHLKYITTLKRLFPRRSGFVAGPGGKVQLPKALPVDRKRQLQRMVEPVNDVGTEDPHSLLSTVRGSSDPNRERAYRRDLPEPKPRRGKSPIASVPASVGQREPKASRCPITGPHNTLSFTRTTQAQLASRTAASKSERLEQSPMTRTMLGDRRPQSSMSRQATQAKCKRHDGRHQPCTTVTPRHARVGDTEQFIPDKYNV